MKQYSLVITIIALGIISAIQFNASAGMFVASISALGIVGGICSRGSEKSDKSMDETYVPAVEEPKAHLTSLPIETIEGIGPKYGEMLRKKGIDTVAKLVVASAEDIDKICKVGLAVANRWIAMSEFCWLDSVSEEDAEAIVYAGGIMDIDELAEANPQTLLDEIKNSVELGHVSVPEGYEFTIEMVQSWIEEAKKQL